MKRILNADDCEMKRNPRNEDLYTFLRERLEELPWLFKVLDSVTDCELEGGEVLLIVDRETGRGIEVVARIDPEAQGFVPVAWKKLQVLSADEDWESLPRALAECEDSRILRQGDLVLIECGAPHLSPEEAVGAMKKFGDPEVLCFYGWEE